LIRDIEKKYKKGNPDWVNKTKVYNSLDSKTKVYNSLDSKTKQDLKDFLIYDDLGKK